MLIITSAIRHSLIRDSMYNDITGRTIDDYNEELQRQQEEQQRQYEQEHYGKMLREQQRQEYEEQLRQQQSDDYYQQQMQEEQQRQYEQEQYEEELRRQQDYQKQLEQESQQEEEIRQQALPSCQSGYLNEYKCSGNNIQKKYQYSDCSFTWVHNYYCAYGCDNGNCKECYDSDGGKDYYTKGYTTLTGGTKEYDECSTGAYKDYVWEHYCAASGTGMLNYECPYGCSDGKCNSEPANITITVSQVLDGDTIQLSNGETIRLIGINAPEQGESCSSGATSKLRQLILGKEITLEQDINDKDQYGRLLRYVYVGTTFVNLEMLKLGFAHKYEYDSNTKYSIKFEQAENEAKQNEGCLWESEEINYIQNQCIYITNFNFNAAGNDNYNLNDEYIIFRNRCSYPIDMTDWAIKDETSIHIYTFPSFTFQSGATFTLYTGTGTNTNFALYWGRTSGDYAAIWNNEGGDTLFLRDSNGNLVLTKSYSGY